MVRSAETRPEPAVQPLPEGYHTVPPYLVVDGAAEAIEFYKRAFGAIEIDRALVVALEVIDAAHI